MGTRRVSTIRAREWITWVPYSVPVWELPHNGTGSASGRGTPPAGYGRHSRRTTRHALGAGSCRAPATLPVIAWTVRDRMEECEREPARRCCGGHLRCAVVPAPWSLTFTLRCPPGRTGDRTRAPHAVVARGGPVGCKRAWSTGSCRRGTVSVLEGASRITARPPTKNPSAAGGVP